MDKIYDHNNVFAKILRKEAPATIIYEDEFALAFPSIYPDAKIHALVIPKGPYIDYTHFMENANRAEIAGLLNAIDATAKILGIENGYKIQSNCGSKAGQVVFHLHFHLLSNKD